MALSQQQLAHKEAVLQAAFLLVPFDGWTESMMQQAAEQANVTPGELILLFPEGVDSAVEYACQYFDTHMIAALEKQDLATMRIRDRIATAVKTRLELYEPHKMVIRKIVQYYMMPCNVSKGMHSVMRTVSHMWYLAGDQSTDINYYSKRFLLSGVYSSTLLYWLSDESEAYQHTWQFLDRRIAEVLNIGSVRKKYSEHIQNLTAFIKRKG